MSELKTIRLYGKLGAKFGRVHRLAVSNTAEAVQALASQYPGFETYMTSSKDHGIAYACFIGKRNLTVSNLADPPGEEDIRIAPIIMGSKSGGVFQFILGAVLFVIGAIMIFGLSWTGIGGVVGYSLMSMGISMMIGGVIQMLTPVPKKPDGRDKPGDDPSYVFNGPVNTQAQGNPVPVLYGRMIVGSAVISAGIIANQLNAGLRPRPVFGGGGVSDILQYVNEYRIYNQEMMLLNVN